MKAIDIAINALEEADQHLSAALAAADFDPAELERIEERLFALRAASRKYSTPVDGLAALAKGLGPDWDDTVVVVISEFGRTVHENGNGGTDHGHGNVVLVLGGNVRGGRVYGDWPGLGKAQLYQGRDLAVTTDYRTVFAVILQRHLGLADHQLTQIFPGLPPAGSNLGELLAA